MNGNFRGFGVFLQFNTPSISKKMILIRSWGTTAPAEQRSPIRTVSLLKNRRGGGRSALLKSVRCIRSSTSLPAARSPGVTVSNLVPDAFTRPPSCVNRSDPPPRTNGSDPEPLLALESRGSAPARKLALGAVDFLQFGSKKVFVERSAGHLEPILLKVNVCLPTLSSSPPFRFQRLSSYLGQL